MKVPTTVVTGFLGSGKTTLIRHLLESANGRRIGLIINEFGELGVDGEILKACGDALCRQEDIIELANGCICCTVADDFIPAMTKLLDREDSLDHIIIETSGLALPQPLVRAFNWPEISSRVTVDGVVTVVDSAALAEGRFADDEEQIVRERDPTLTHDNPLEELFKDQLNCADMVLLNKTDLVDRSTIERLKGELQSNLRAGTRLVATELGRTDVAALLGLEAKAESDVAHRPSIHELEGEGEHDHDDFESFVVELPPVVDRHTLIDRIGRAIASYNVLRLKGYLALEGNSARMLVQAVGPRVNCYFDRPWHSDEVRISRLVVIGLKGIDRPAIEAALAA